jgi:hypothetical protein
MASFFHPKHFKYDISMVSLMMAPYVLESGNSGQLPSCVVRSILAQGYISRFLVNLIMMPMMWDLGVAQG